MFSVPTATAADYLACEEDYWYFLTTHCKALDPKEPDPAKRIRLIEPYEFLRELAEPLQAGKNTHALKSRQMIVTTAICAYYLWNLLFRDGWSGLMTSRKDTLVDDGGSRASWNSLFGRVLFMWRNLPTHLRHRLDVKSMLITCPARGSYLVGESGNVPDAGRGGVFSSVFMDETAKIKRSESVWSAVHDATKQVIMASTPFGKQGLFYRMHMLPNSGFVKVRLHWKRHPDRDQSWYEEQCKNRTPEDIAEELDCSFAKSVKGRCVPEFDFERNVSFEARYVNTQPLYGGWDFGIGDPTAVVFRQLIRGQHWFPASIQRSNLIVSDFAPLATAVVRRMGYEGYLGGIRCTGDAEGGGRSRQTGITDLAAYRDLGWNIGGLRCHEKERIRRWRIICKNGAKIHPENGELIECLQQHHYPFDAERVIVQPDGKVVTGMVTDGEHSDPKDHHLSHLPDAGGYDLTANVQIGAPLETSFIEGL